MEFDDYITNRLNYRESDIAKLVISGLTNEQIASKLQLSNMTVKKHLGRVFIKLNAINRTNLAYTLGSHTLKDDYTGLKICK